MPRVIGQTAYGNSVLQDDGTVVFLPPWADAGFGAGTPSQADLAGMAPDAPLNPPVPAPDAIAPDGSALAPPAVAPAPPLDVTQPQKVIEPPPSNVLGFPDGSPSASTAAAIAPGPPVVEAPQPAVEAPPVAPPVPAPEPAPPLTPVDQAAQAEIDKAAIAQAKSAEDVRVYNEATAAEQTALDNVRAERENYARQFDSTRSAYEMATKEAAKFDARVPEDTTGTKFSKLIFLALGGLGQVLQRQGGPNPVMAILDAAVEREAQSRLKRYQQLQAKAGGLKAGMDAIADMAKTPEGYLNGVRASIRARLTTEIEKNAATFAGPTALATAKAVNADNLAKADKAKADAARSDADAALNAQKQTEIERKNRADEKIAAGQLKVQWSGEKRANKQFAADQAWKLAEFLRDLNKNQNLSPSEKKALYDIEKDQQSREIGGVPTVTMVGGKPTLTSGKMTNADGQPFRAPRAEVRDELAKLKSSTTIYAELIDNIVRAREQQATGWASDIRKSPYWQRAQSLWADAAFEKKDMAALGVLAGADLGMIGKAMGTNDPTEIRSPIAGLRQSRETALRKLNVVFADNGYTGAEIAIPELTEAGLEKDISGPSVPAIKAAQEELTKTNKPPARSMPKLDPNMPDLVIPGIVEPPAVKKVPLSDAKLQPLLVGAKGGDAGALAGLAQLARKDETVALRALDAGIDLSSKFTPEEWAAITKGRAK